MSSEPDDFNRTSWNLFWVVSSSGETRKCFASPAPHPFAGIIRQKSKCWVPCPMFQKEADKHPSKTGHL
jgi:hypothetical protein